MSSAETGLPEGWEVRRSNTKNLPYYFHAQTKDSRWEPPQGTNPDKLKAYMAANHSSKGVAPAAVAVGGEPKITRSVEEARTMIENYHKQIQAYEEGKEDPNAKSLSELATTEGFFGRGDMQKEFEQAAFDLEKGQARVVH
ncbi:unnamed protein product [Alternaria alternata]